jgi:NTP pyrophosphatase (non-canonical NTP hydrolase)
MDFEKATNKALAFRDERDWEQFHNPKDLAISINLEAAELLEVFQWSGADLKVDSKADRLKEEMADVVIYCIYLADALGVNLADAVSSKIDDNAKKYPIEKARGNARKYSEL